ncbi:hypothetical protein DSL92_03685 [Billgrantia gudaonensis]|uniref:Uncharacterized protein n=1 Tax=Billgrantia gudaonensis TaxID=376427 RepID=A0A432JJQ7_9GAMM|nr:hypothetical protein DSL92_03685 [Halomonas gudaonensis]
MSLGDPVYTDTRTTPTGMTQTTFASTNNLWDSLMEMGEIGGEKERLLPPGAIPTWTNGGRDLFIEMVRRSRLQHHRGQDGQHLRPPSRSGRFAAPVAVGAIAGINPPAEVRQRLRRAGRPGDLPYPQRTGHRTRPPGGDVDQRRGLAFPARHGFLGRVLPLIWTMA